MYSVVDFMIRAGFPTATLLSGMSWVTTLPAPMTTLLPIVTPGRITEPAPTNVLLPMRTRPIFVYPRCFFVLASCASMITCFDRVHSSPIEISQQNEESKETFSST